jgi:hypothetical protein
MPKRDLIIVTCIWLLAATIAVIGGLYHPNTIAGSIARFVFSLE